MLGAIAGDIIGSTHEFIKTKDYNFDLLTPENFFTDDTVMTLATAKWLMESEDLSEWALVRIMVELGRKYPYAGYGSGFNNWIWSESPLPYNSFGNGSAMRVSPIGLYAHSLSEALELAYISARVSHNHPEGIKGAQATAAAIYMARAGYSKEQIREVIMALTGYNLNRTIEEVRPTIHWTACCQKSVPESIIAFLDGRDFEDVIRLAVSLGGDADTMGAIAGSIAACVYPIPENIATECEKKLTPELLKIMKDFEYFLSNRDSCGFL